ncbi:unnamed protein product [Prorocentrum cordatum]|uniref:Cyclic nucleotide-binding domain-containing protein n=1 Tax=Prorocentrum cordatum TaxID=2364126 RepID=A0ABN9UZ54_9DINO|nr:unnamed protein product [Polarella glacialis]
MTRETFEKVMAALPEQRAGAERSILQEMAGKAVERLGFSRGSVGILRFSSLFRAVSDEFATLVSQKLEERIYQPGELITEEGAAGSSMYLLLAGDVEVEAGGGPPAACGGRQAFGEAVLLRVAGAYSTTLRARSSCLVQALSRRSLDEVLASFPEERGLFDGLRVEGGGGGLECSLSRSPSFSGTAPEFVALLCRHSEDVFYAPGEEIVTRGDACALGRSSIFLLVSGQAVVEGLHSQCLGSLGPGHIFGEAGALGFAPSRSATVRAGRGGLTHCAMLQGPAIEEATRRFPETHGLFRALFEEREEANACIEGRREDWVHAVVVPALRRSRLFAGLPAELVRRVSLPLSEVRYGAGEYIAAGEELDRMFFLLHGRAEARRRRGGRVLCGLSDGAVLGEAAALGLLPVSTAAVRAASECRALVVPAGGVRAVAASAQGAAPLRQALQLLRQERLRQAESGLPLCALGLGFAAQDFCARVVNLQAECVELHADACWHPRPDSDPCGPHFGVLVGGRGALVLGLEERPVMALAPGSLLPEGLYAKYGAHVRAQAAGQVYRVRLVDFMLALGSAPSSFKSFVLFEALWKEARERACARLKCACGARGALSCTVSDAGIRPRSSWSLSRGPGPAEAEGLLEPMRRDASFFAAGGAVRPAEEPRPDLGGACARLRRVRSLPGPAACARLAEA